MRYALEHAAIEGPVNATAPLPVINAEFVRMLGKSLHRPAIVPAPAFALRLLFGEMSEVLLGSQRVLPAAADAAHYQFRHPELGAALRDLLG
jgi:NAD dependent epimerase/dehydratase family enzyme